MSSNSTNIINPKTCNYGCGTRIYWDTVSNSFLELFSKQKHICKNRSANKPVSTQNYTDTTKSNYYNKFSKQPKPKMSNSIELISGPISEVQNNYEILSDLVTEYQGKVHGSQSHFVANGISLIVYFEIPEGKREQIKQNFDFKRKMEIKINS
ncbi:MAG TPA: hypothetical protein VFM31_03525 [Nitrososphaeraceae archaeon]|nr:hypothetical protein [Nitrososphaeraceae archaeon]